MPYRKKEIVFAELDSGTYLCTLSNIKECEVAKWVRDSHGTPTIQGKRSGFRLVFKCLERENAYVCPTVADSDHKDSKFFKMAQMLNDSLLNHIKFNDKGYAEDEHSYYQTLMSKKGEDFYVTAEKKDKYINFIDAQPKNSDKKSREITDEDVKDVEQQSLSSKPLEDDDIPF